MYSSEKSELGSEVREEKNPTYSFVSEPVITISHDVNDDHNASVYREYDDYDESPSFLSQIKNFNKLSIWDRIDVAGLIALTPCAIGIVFAYLFLGVVLNAAFWALNFWIFTDLRGDGEIFYGIILGIAVDVPVLAFGFAIFKKWFFLVLALSFGLAMWVFNM